MDLLTFQRRSLVHHWRAQLAVLLGVAAATAALSGALFVGDSMRGSLRDMALERLGRVTHAVQTPTTIRAALADEIAQAPEAGTVVPVTLLTGSARHAATRAAVHRVAILGIDDRFWQLDQTPLPPGGTAGWGPSGSGLAVLLNQPLADDLGAQPGDDLLLRVARPALISPELLLGQRADTTLALRLTVQAIIPAAGSGVFALQPRQTLPRNAFVPLATLQRALGQPERVNTLLVAAPALEASDEAHLTQLLARHATLTDLNLRLRANPNRGYVAVESDTLLLPPIVEDATRAAARALGCEAPAILSGLANSIAVEARPDTEVPYSTVAAIEATPALLSGLTLADGTPAPPLAPGEILLNDWTAAALAAQPGETIRLTYYAVGPLGRLDTQAAAFRLRGIVRLAGAAADTGFTAEYPGVTDADSLSDWHPPFPIDLHKIRPADEQYWKDHRATPKAFITLADGVRLWAADHERFGRVTSVRLYPAPGQTAAGLEPAFDAALHKQLDVAALGLRVEPVRARALAASAGATDFASLFLGFSCFLIASAAMLIALLFRLGVERRAAEIGLLLALGFEPRRIAGILLAQGTVIAALGAALGLWAGHGYAWLLLAGLRSWWLDAVHTAHLRLHTTLTSYGIGYLSSVVIASAAIALALHGLTRISPRALLAGGVAQPTITTTPRRARIHLVLAVLLLGGALALMALSLLTETVPAPTAFFIGGTALLLAGLVAVTAWLRSEPHTALRPSDPSALLRLGVRNARRHAGRSLLTAGLIAAATFIITALQAMRLDAPANTQDRRSGTGGFALLAESDAPLTYDLNTAAGRAALGISDAGQATLTNTQVFPLRLRAGDETSCLNLYQPRQPRIVGAPDALLDRNGFTFAASCAQTPDEQRNPWLLLHRPLPDGVIPAIADEAAALWQLHVKLGGELHVPRDRGPAARLRLVGLLRGSILQGEIIIAETDFARLFPTTAGYSYFLIDTPPERVADVRQTLSRELADFGLEVTPTAARLADLRAVQNTYLSTYQTLGGLGLLLGTVGLAAVLLRNVWERRSELALLRALGFARVALGLLVLSENALLVATGLLIGLLSAAVVAAPHVLARTAVIPWASLLLMFSGILVAGLLVGILALATALRAPLLPALRSE